jgi:oligoribonuclease
MDRRFIEREWTRLNERLHYRMLDVSAVKILHELWQPEHLQKRLPEKKMTHRAIDDIKESIAELRFYRANIFSI